MSKLPPHSDGSERAPRSDEPRAGSESKGAGRRRRGRTSGCRTPEARALLLPYLTAGCSEAEAVTFEAHLVGCAACFRDLKALDRVGTLLHELLGLEPPSLD